MLGARRDTQMVFTMKSLIQSILANPHDFEPAQFPHCGIQALIRIAQEETPKPADLESAVISHDRRVSHLVVLPA